MTDEGGERGRAPLADPPDRRGRAPLADLPDRRGRAPRRVVAVVAFVGAFVFLLFVAGIGVSRIADRAQNDYSAEKIETARWDCVEAFVRSATSDGELLRLAIEPADDTYVRQRVIESVYPAVQLTSSDAAPVLRVAVRPGEDADTTCRGLKLSIERA